MCVFIIIIPIYIYCIKHILYNFIQSSCIFKFANFFRIDFWYIFLIRSRDDIDDNIYTYKEINIKDNVLHMKNYNMMMRDASAWRNLQRIPCRWCIFSFNQKSVARARARTQLMYNATTTTMTTFPAHRKV